jgi:hypothetical protein
LNFLFIFVFASPADSIVQWDNQTSVAAVCHLVACALPNHKLTTVGFDHEPSFCVATDTWMREQLPVPPAAVASGAWGDVLPFLRVRHI